ncbi:MAG: Ig-like domain-containing protein [Nitrospirae bacterium]|nr:Ig-like domain-containing protein [Nitrospirota bacterium]
MSILGGGLTGCGSDPELPQLFSITPDDGSVNVSLNSNIIVTFDQSMSAASIEGTSNFSLEKESDSTGVAAGISYNGSTLTAILDPDADLEPETTYRVSLTTDVKSSDGAALVREYTWTFTTGRLNDSTLPVFSGLKEIDPGDVGSDSVTLRWDPASDNATDTADMGYLIFSSTTAGAQNYLNPTYRTRPGATSYLVTGLDPETTYYLVVLALDEAGNFSTVIVERSVTTLAAADTLPPTVINLRPLDGDVNVAVNTNMRVTFSEDMDDTTFVAEDDPLTPDEDERTVRLSDSTGTPVAGSASYNPSTQTLIFTPLGDLLPGSTYLFTVTTGVKDTAGNGLDTDFSYSFTTSP